MKNVFFVRSILVILLLMPFLAFGKKKTETIITVGHGQTESEAVDDALNKAITQTFGVFVSSNTTVQNEDLIRDHVAQISSGYIKKYEIVTQGKIDNRHIVTLRSFLSSKALKDNRNEGSFNGDVFAKNLRNMQDAKKTEWTVLRDLLAAMSKISEQTVFYNYSLYYDSVPKKNTNGKYFRKFTLFAKANKNLYSAEKMIFNTLDAISLEYDDYVAAKEQNVPLNVTVWGGHPFEEEDITEFDLRMQFAKKKVVNNRSYDGHKLFFTRNDLTIFFQDAYNLLVPHCMVSDGIHKITPPAFINHSVIVVDKKIMKDTMKVWHGDVGTVVTNLSISRGYSDIFGSYKFDSSQNIEIVLPQVYSLFYGNEEEAKRFKRESISFITKALIYSLDRDIGKMLFKSSGKTDDVSEGTNSLYYEWEWNYTPEQINITPKTTVLILQPSFENY